MDLTAQSLREKEQLVQGAANGQTWRYTIGLLTQGAIDPNNRAIWSGAAAAARDTGMNLICFPGRTIRSPAEFEAQSNIIYDLIDSRTLDGLVVWGLTPWLDVEETWAFLRRYRSLPIVTTGILLDGMPGVSVDNYHGMREVVTHLIDEHGRRQIAFIRGPAFHQEAIDRYQAYLDVLAERGIPLDPELIYQGNFKENGGVAGAQELLDRRKVKFDALVAASDNMAIGAMKTLQARGVRVPADVSIAGLNGEDQGLVITPPLTTSPLHFYEQAYQATQMVLTMLRGGQVPQRVVLPTRMVVRQSCGCPDPLIVHARAIPFVEKTQSSTDEIRLLNSAVFGEGDASLQLQPGDRIRMTFPHLLKAFLSAARGKSADDFLGLLVDSLQQTASEGDAYTRWHEIISLLRHFALSQLTEADTRLQVENLAQQARVAVGESARRWYAYQTLQADEKLHILGEINQSLSITTSIEELAGVLERALPLLNISSCYLSLYEDPQNPAEQARLIIAYEQGQHRELEPGGRLFPSRRLIPDGILAADRRHSLVVIPLHFREDQLGYAIFDADPREEAIYEILGGQISAALKRTLLTERNIRLYNEAVEARRAAEEANLLKSRFLSMVSHELRTPLALIVGTIEMMGQEESAGCLPPLPDSYRKDMDCIQTSAQHLSRLIGDVLDLASDQAGELRLAREPLDMKEILEEVALLGKSLAREKGLTWQEVIPPVLPLVWGDRTRLRQVTLNLVSNAVKFTERGKVALIVEAAPNTITVQVQDTGMGIPLSEQQTIFDEFRRSERSVERGYGGMGLGLAISRRLIELHGGQIGVLSSGEEETGSTFYFTIPVLSDTTFLLDTSQGRRRRVLLLAESAYAAQPVVDHLRGKGFDVEAIGIDQDAGWLNQVIAAPPGAVVLDFQPATERGWDLMRTLRQSAQTRDIPVIFYALSGDRSLGATLEIDYMAKPIGSLELAQALERLGLGGERKHQTILVVDDDPYVLDMHIRMLENQVPGCETLKAHNGREALQVMGQQRPDLVLLDLMMPEMDGFAVLEAMREQESTRKIPVIVLTAQILTAPDMARLQQGVAAVLGKGLFSAAEVMNQIEATLSHSKRLGSEAMRIVRRAMAYIHEHYPEPVSRKELADHLAVSERYLTRCFHQELGITPVTYLNRYRIHRAKDLLDQGNISVTEVALQVGFSDSNYFGRVFRDEVGKSPSAYLNGQGIG
jgi:signal transduction histidine kinase/DNA-binding LacI/PurR family transcriptional regulator/CheY-like chemotaxis protein